MFNWKRKNEVINERSEAELEASRLSDHVEILQNLFADIVAQETPHANATVKRMANIARAGLAK